MTLHTKTIIQLSQNYQMNSLDLLLLISILNCFSNSRTEILLFVTQQTQICLKLRKLQGMKLFQNMGLIQTNLQALYQIYLRSTKEDRQLRVKKRSISIRLLVKNTSPCIRISSNLAQKICQLEFKENTKLVRLLTNKYRGVKKSKVNKIGLTEKVSNQ